MSPSNFKTKQRVSARTEAFFAHLLLVVKNRYYNILFLFIISIPGNFENKKKISKKKKISLLAAEL